MADYLELVIARSNTLLLVKTSSITAVVAGDEGCTIYIDGVLNLNKNSAFIVTESYDKVVSMIVSP